MCEPMIEIVSAKKYYKHPYAKGSVLLYNGHVEYHNSTAEVKKFYKELQRKKVANGLER